MDILLSVFLGGSCNPTVWRKEITIPILQNEGITYYDPVSMERARETRQRDRKNKLLFSFCSKWIIGIQN